MKRKSTTTTIESSTPKRQKTITNVDKIRYIASTLDVSEFQTNLNKLEDKISALKRDQKEFINSYYLQNLKDKQIDYFVSNCKDNSLDGKLFRVTTLKYILHYKAIFTCLKGLDYFQIKKIELKSSSENKNISELVKINDYNDLLNVAHFDEENFREIITNDARNLIQDCIFDEDDYSVIVYGKFPREYYLIERKDDKNE
jgi:hypothetical protein